MHPSLNLPVSLRLCAALLVLTLLPFHACPAKPVPPDWLKAAMAAPMNGLEKDADAVMLLDYSYQTFSRDGISQLETRRAFRIVNENGIRCAVASFNYLNGNDKVSDLRAWLILPGGEVREYKDKDFLRFEATNYTTLYTEDWVRLLSLSGSARVGSVFAWTYKVRGMERFPTYTQYTRGEYPVLASECTIVVPQGWQVRSVPVNKPVADEHFDGKTYSLSTRMQPSLKEEDYAPADSTFPYFAVAVIPTEADRARNHMTCFESWNDVARYDVEMNDPQAIPDAAIRAKVAELTGKLSDPWEKIRAIAGYVQAVNYVSVNKDLAKGGGFKPNSAASVFSHNYGDCKDKTALLRAMLSCIGVESFSVSCRIGGRVNPNVPTEKVFNHCITVFRPPEGLESPAIVDHSELGRLLIFDPTNNITPVGFISDGLCRTNLLVSSASCKGLTRVPETGKGMELVNDVTIDAAGTLSGTLVETKQGVAADEERALLRSGSSDSYKRVVTEWLRAKTRDTQILDLSHVDDTAKNSFTLTVRFEAPGYARRIGASKLLFKAFPPNSGSLIPEAQKEERKSPAVVPWTNLVNDSTFTLPEGLEVDELPADISVEEKFGSLKFSARVEGNKIQVHLEAKTRAVILPPEDYTKLREFFKARDKAFQATLVVRKIAAK